MRKTQLVESKTKKSHCHSKYCPALIVMLHKVFGWDVKQIAKSTGYKQNGTRNVLNKHGFVTKHHGACKSDIDLEQIEREYLSGKSSYALADKYGVHPGTISRWMRQRGIKLGKGAHQEGREGRTKENNTFIYTERMQEINQSKHEKAERHFASRLAKYQDGRFEYVKGFRPNGKLLATIRCVKCGYEFVHGITDIDKKQWKCPECTRTEHEQHEQEREVERYDRMVADIREYALDKKCLTCGCVFHNSYANKKYCSKKCRENRAEKHISTYRHYFHVKYGDRYRDYYDPSITLKKLYERDGGICQICGKPCDWNDMEWGHSGPTYPSLDHIIPRAKGGEHTWDNVQLAHCMCNSKKRDLTNEDARELVITDVKVAS